MTDAADWVTVSTPEFVAWTRHAGVALPFPLSSGGLSFVPGPDADELRRLLASRRLADSLVLEAARAALGRPRLSVYAVRAGIDAVETRYYAAAGAERDASLGSAAAGPGDGDTAVLVLLDDRQVAVRAVADTELAAGVVGALPPAVPLPFTPCEVSVDALHEVDAAVESGVSARTLRATMSRLGFAPELIALRERVGNSPAASGALGAMVYEAGEAPRHSTRSVTWREYDGAAYVQVERGVQRGEARVLLAPWSPDVLFRAAVDAVASCYPQRSRVAPG